MKVSLDSSNYQNFHEFLILDNSQNVVLTFPCNI